MTDARLTRDREPSPTLPVGRRLPNVAEQQFQGWVKYGIQDGPLRGPSFSLGAIYLSERYGNLNTTFAMPGYTRVDASIRYAKGRYSLGANATNLLDREYFSSGSTVLRPAAPLTLRTFVRYKF